MKKTYKLTDLDCANCAAKMENAIKKIDGVSDASVSFLTQKLVLEADESRLDDILNGDLDEVIDALVAADRAAKLEQSVESQG